MAGRAKASCYYRYTCRSTVATILIRTAAPVSQRVYQNRERRLAKCRTDKELFERVIVAEHGNGANWLWEICQQDVQSSIVKNQTRALALLGFSSAAISSAQEILETYAKQDPACWLTEVARKAIASRRNNDWAQHWYRRFLTAEGDELAQVAFQLLLRCADRRFWIWHERFESPTFEDSELAMRRTFFQNNYETLRNRMQANEETLEQNLLGTKVLPGEVAPWLN